MKKRITNLSIRQIVLAAIIVVSLLIFALLSIISLRMVRSLDDQQMAGRWSSEGGYAQISCFFAAPVEPMEVLSFRNQIESGLKEASYEMAAGAARTYLDAYSSQGRLTVKSSRDSLETAAVGVGGDFFLFHPFELVSGGYFAGDDLMKDYVILDEQAAWLLFGSNDVVGMPVTIGEIPHYVAGVIKRAEGRMWESAGLLNGVIYVSNETLAAYGESEGIRHYEVLMPNPVSGFAYRMVKERFGYDELAMEVVDNTARFALEPLFRIIADFGLRSMQHYAIRYPYWENYARGIEDVLAVLLILRFIFLALPVVILLILLIRWYRRRTWTWREVGKKCWQLIRYLVGLLVHRWARRKGKSSWKALGEAETGEIKIKPDRQEQKRLRQMKKQAAQEERKLLKATKVKPERRRKEKKGSTEPDE